MLVCRPYKLLFGLLLLFYHKEISAQDNLPYRFVNGSQLTVLGRAAAVPSTSFHRIDTINRKKLPKAVAALATNSAGISITFQTNAKNIKVKWILGKYNTLSNMTPIAVNGIDLYGWNGKQWQYIAAAKPVSDSNTATVISHLDGVMRHYRIYLPLYAELKEIAIGVDSSALIKKANPELMPRKKVVVYGSSITQGASASRPGMAYPSIVSRHLNIETFNMGFSGSGKMELAMADVLAGMEADVYILDCVPNPSPEEIEERCVPFVKRLRQLKPHIPIIMVESIFREDAYWNSDKNTMVKRQNGAFRKAYMQLIQEKYGHLYYVFSTNLIGNDHEATIDGTHLTDVGFMRFAEQMESILKKIL